MSRGSLPSSMKTIKRHLWCCLVKALGMSEGPHGLVNTTWRSRKDKYRVILLFFLFPRRLLDRHKSQQSRTLAVTILVHLGNYLRNLLCGHRPFWRPFYTLATDVIFTSRDRDKTEALLSPVEGSLDTVYSRYTGYAAQAKS